MPEQSCIGVLPINQVLCGDCVEVLKTLPDESVDMAMFSPPYWGLRDYGISGQIGLEEHPSKYIKKMVQVCQEVKRLLKKTGSMYIVIGDTYYGSGVKDPSDPSHGKMTRGSFCAAAKASQAIQNKYQTNWLQPKQLLGIPWRVAIALQEDCWILRNDVIWNKPNHMPSSVKDRLTNAYDHIFHFVKSRKYYYDLDAIREKPTSLKPSGNKQRKPSLQPRNSHVGRSIPWSPYRPESPPQGNRGKHKGIWGFDSFKRRKIEETAEFFKEKGSGGNVDLPQPAHVLGKNPSDVIYYPPHEPRHFELLAMKGVTSGGHTGKTVRHDHPDGKNPSDFWNITTKPFKGAHFAVYPEDVCIKPILSSCPQWTCKKCGKPRERINKRVGEIVNQWGVRRKKPWFDDPREMPQKIIKEGIFKTIGLTNCGCGEGFESGIVLDPMCGSGTTLAVAKKLRRNYIGIDIVPAYVKMSIERLESTPEPDKE